MPTNINIQNLIQLQLSNTWNINSLSIINDQRVTPYANQREATAQAYYVMIEKFNMKQFSDWQISLILDE